MFDKIIGNMEFLIQDTQINTGTLTNFVLNHIET